MGHETIKDVETKKKALPTHDALDLIMDIPSNEGHVLVKTPDCSNKTHDNDKKKKTASVHKTPDNNLVLKVPAVTNPGFSGIPSRPIDNENNEKTPTVSNNAAAFPMDGSNETVKSSEKPPEPNHTYKTVLLSDSS